MGTGGGAERVDGCSVSFDSAVGFISSIVKSAISPQSPRIQPECIAAASGSESSE